MEAATAFSPETVRGLFVPHGAPTFALNPGAAGAALVRAAARLPRPRAVIMVSAHWGTENPVVGTARQFGTVHDYRGFPAPLYALRYPASGCGEAAREVAQQLRLAGFDVAEDAQRGLDHGAWIPLRLIYPHADVPVIPLSLQPHLGPAHHLAVGRALAPLAQAGFLVIGSGNLTHNLGDYQEAARSGRAMPDYVRSFPEWIWSRLQEGDEAALLDYREAAPAAPRAHPSDEHLLPFYVALGAAGAQAAAQRLHAGVDDYVIAMDAFAFHGDCGGAHAPTAAGMGGANQKGKLS
jgi:4,5-DOPA dioxygenase extradiol